MFFREQIVNTAKLRRSFEFVFSFSSEYYLWCSVSMRTVITINVSLYTTYTVICHGMCWTHQKVFIYLQHITKRRTLLVMTLSIRGCNNPHCNICSCVHSFITHSFLYYIEPNISFTEKAPLTEKTSFTYNLSSLPLVNAHVLNHGNVPKSEACSKLWNNIYYIWWP